MITGKSYDGAVLTRTEGGWYDISPLLVRLEERLRRNVAGATRKINAGFGLPPSPGKIGGDTEGIEVFFGGRMPAGRDFDVEADCTAGATLVLAKGLIDTLNPGEFDRLYTLSDIYRWSVVVGGGGGGKLLQGQQGIASPFQMEMGDWGYVKGRDSASPLTGLNLIRVSPGRWWVFTGGHGTVLNYPEWEALLKKNAGQAQFIPGSVTFLNVSR